jgi:hypothetical protein
MLDEKIITLPLFVQMEQIIVFRFVNKAPMAATSNALYGNIHPKDREWMLIRQRSNWK